ncbi:MAG: trypsin-like peptidase domain-containing protein [Bryobacteraceae bacterium]
MNVIDKIRKEKLLSLTLVVFTLSIGVLIGTLVNTGVNAAKGQAAPGATPLSIPSPVQLQSSFAQLAKQLEPSVVHISTTYEQKAAQQKGRSRRPQPGEEDQDMGDLFQRFFGNPFGDMPRGRRGAATGSGVIIDPAGYLLTNNHVVEKADRIQVTLSHSTEKLDAKLIGTDPETDLAVLKIDTKKPLTAAKIGNSDGIQVGDWAVAIGSPFGLQATVTAGIISAKERDLGGLEHQFQRFLQTDAAINPGNSGGPLININGEVIGINTAIASGTGGYQGIGFALPVNTAAKVYNQIIKVGKVSRGAIGVGFKEAKPELLAVYGAKEGVFVESVSPDMPAAKAGIKPEDVIIAIDGKPVRDGQDLVGRISDTPVGNPVTITVIRDKKKQDFKVIVGDRQKIVNSERDFDRPGEAERNEGTPAKFGIEIQNFAPSRREALGFREEGGVLVSQVATGSFADDIGLAVNDVILSINRQPVKSVDDVRRIQGTLKPGDAVAMRVMRMAAVRRDGTRDWAPLFLAGTMRDQ